MYIHIIYNIYICIHAVNTPGQREGNTESLLSFPPKLIHSPVERLGCVLLGESVVPENRGEVGEVFLISTQSGSHLLESQGSTWPIPSPSLRGACVSRWRSHTHPLRSSSPASALATQSQPPGRGAGGWTELLPHLRPEAAVGHWAETTRRDSRGRHRSICRSPPMWRRLDSRGRWSGILCPGGCSFGSG